MTREQRLCKSCRERPALYQSKARRSDGRVRADKDHDLCFQCHRDEANRQRALRMAS
jgi:hypothetical protein